MRSLIKLYRVIVQRDTAESSHFKLLLNWSALLFRTNKFPCKLHVPKKLHVPTCDIFLAKQRVYFACLLPREYPRLKNVSLAKRSWTVKYRSRDETAKMFHVVRHKRVFRYLFLFITQLRSILSVSLLAWHKKNSIKAPSLARVARNVAHLCSRITACARLSILVNKLWSSGWCMSALYILSVVILIVCKKRHVLRECLTDLRAAFLHNNVTQSGKRTDYKCWRVASMMRHVYVFLEEDKDTDLREEADHPVQWIVELVRRSPLAKLRNLSLFMIPVASRGKIYNI